MLPVNLQDALVTALNHRPELQQAGEEISAAAVRLSVSKHELLPVLNAVLEGYVTGLNGDYNVADSFADQFSRGQPGYTAGLVFEMPLGNRAARARHERRMLELARLESQLQDLTSKVKGDVEVSVRDIHRTHQQLYARKKAAVAAAAEVDNLQQRLHLQLDEEDAAGTILNFLIDAQDRLLDEETALAKAQTEYLISIINLKRAMGTLVK